MDIPLSWALSARWADFPELTPCLLLQFRMVLCAPRCLACSG